MEYKWNDIISDIENNDIDKIVQICRQLDVQEYEIVMCKLINEMKYTDKICNRNTMAIVLSDLKCNQAIGEMISLIKNPENSKSIGTIIYALQNLDCEKNILTIFDLLFKGNYEVRCNMYNLLECKIDKMDEKDIEKCLEIIQKEKKDTEEKFELIEDLEENVFKKYNEQFSD